jgi:hypothetical protein
MTKHDSSDPLIDEIREVRRRISERFGHDPRKLVEHYMELQKRHADRLIDRSGKLVNQNGHDEN